MTPGARLIHLLGFLALVIVWIRPLIWNNDVIELISWETILLTHPNGVTRIDSHEVCPSWVDSTYDSKWILCYRFDSTHDSKWILWYWFNSTHDSKWILWYWFDSTHDSSKNGLIRLKKAILSRVEYKPVANVPHLYQSHLYNSLEQWVTLY